MRDDRIDFAGLTPAELEGGAPVIWPTWVRLSAATSASEADARFPPEFWREIKGIIVRWGDPNFDEIMALWHRKWVELIVAERSNASLVEADTYAYFRLHDEGRVSVVLPNWVVDLHAIPKMLGTTDTNSDEDPLPTLDPEFIPWLYHQNQPEVTVYIVKFDQSAEAAERLFLSRDRDHILYVESRDFVFGVHMGARINRTRKQAAS